MRLFTSDLHFNHANILAYCDRPFGSVDEMNEEIVKRWNDTVQDFDEVWILGDVALSMSESVIELCQRLRGIKRLVPGNHDVAWPGHKKVAQSSIEKTLRAGFSIEPHTSGLTLANKEYVKLCHFPYVGDSHDADRFTHMRPSNNGRWLLHGHVHEKFLMSGRQINVGVDKHSFFPWSEDELIQLMQEHPNGANL